MLDAKLSAFRRQAEGWERGEGWRGPAPGLEREGEAAHDPARRSRILALAPGRGAAGFESEQKLPVGAEGRHADDRQVLSNRDGELVGVVRVARGRTLERLAHSADEDRDAGPRRKDRDRRAGRPAPPLVVGDAEARS